MEVKREPHRIANMTALGVQDVHIQDKVFADSGNGWKFVGYIGLKEGARFAPAVTGLRQEQCEEIAKQLGTASGIAPPDPVQTTSTDEQLEIDVD